MTSLREWLDDLPSPILILFVGIGLWLGGHTDAGAILAFTAVLIVGLVQLDDRVREWRQS